MQKRISNISLLGQEMESHTTEGLLGLHIFTGVNSTSAFVGKGKKKTIVLFKQYIQFQRGFESFGTHFTTCDAFAANMERFVCKF